MTTLVWFRQDLRTSDHDALLDACARGAVVPVFIWHPNSEGRWPIGGAQRWWLHHSLQRLADDLKSRGSRLIVRAGDPAVELASLARACAAKRVVCSRRYEPAAMADEERITEVLQKSGIEIGRAHV